MWATLVTGATLHEVLSKFSSGLRIPASQANSLINDKDLLSLLELGNVRDTSTRISCKVVSVLLSLKLPTSRYVTKCKPERTIRNCVMAYYR